VLYKIKLKNADDTIVLDANVYEWLTSDPYLAKVDFINNLRKHSSGCAVFQKFLIETKTKTDNLVGAKNGNKLDCRLENIVYRSRAVASRKRKTSSKTGYTGVYQENQRYRAVISQNGKSMHIGMFDTAEEAALAYNRKSKEIYGDTGKLNVIKRQKGDGSIEEVTA
jgi:hypothetical protein